MPSVPESQSGRLTPRADYGAKSKTPPRRRRRKQKPSTKNAVEFSEEWCRLTLKEIMYVMKGTRAKHTELLRVVALFNEHAELWARPGRVALVQEEMDTTVRQIRRMAKRELKLTMEVVDAFRTLASPEVNTANETLWKEEKKK